MLCIFSLPLLYSHLPPFSSFLPLPSSLISSSSNDSYETTATAGQSNVLSSPEYTSCEDATYVEICHESSLDSTLLASDSNMDDSVLAMLLTSEQLTNNDNELNNEAPTKLYEGSSLSVEGSHILISSYMYRHHLTGQACEDLLNSYGYICPKPASFHHLHICLTSILTTLET